MEPVTFVVMVGIAAGGGAFCPPSEPAPPFYNNRGPEVTGDYSRHYLYSAETQQTYADPMYYYASDTVSRWNRTHSISTRTSTRSTAGQLEK